MAKPALIAVDWGTTSFRAWLVRDDGTIADRRALNLGIARLGDLGFRQAFETAVGDWHDGGRTRVLMSGMVGSRQGWVEAAYLPCPARLDQLAGHLVPVPELRSCHIVPGLSQSGEGLRPDVMRGEETQVMALGLRRDGVVVLPGTHSKWVLGSDGAVRQFTTFFTGELYDLLIRHSMIGKAMDPGEHAPKVDGAFLNGVREALSADHPGTLQSLFMVRASGLLGVMPPGQLPMYLSGLLVGAELREGMAWLRARGLRCAHVDLIGHGDLVALYAAAFAEVNIDATIHGEETVVAGLIAISSVIDGHEGHELQP